MDDPGARAGSGPSGSADERAGEAVDHLRAAARELIGAVRGFLDVAEELIDDPKAGEAVVETVTTLAEAARRGARSVVREADPSGPEETFQTIDLED